MLKVTPQQLHSAAQSARQTTMMAELIRQRKAVYEQSAATHEAQGNPVETLRNKAAAATLECLLSEIDEALAAPPENRPVEETLPLFLQDAMRTQRNGQFSGKVAR